MERLVLLFSLFLYAARVFDQDESVPVSTGGSFRRFRRRVAGIAVTGERAVNEIR